MPKQDRLALLIDGEPVVSLDYRQVAPRILYGISNATPDAEDMYAIADVHPFYRDGMKKLFNAYLFTEGPLKRKPKETKVLLPGDDVATLCNRISASHPKIAHHLGTSIGHHLQFIESEIMMKVLRELMRLNIVALPIHDAVVVAASKAEEAKAVMLRASEQVAGITIPVSQERTTPQ